MSGDRMEMVYNIFYPAAYGIPDNTPVGAIRKGNWKYIKRTVGYAGNHCPPEMCSNFTNKPSISDVQDGLYNIAEDPTESVNLFDTEPDIAEDLMMLLERYIAALPEEPYPENNQAGNPSNFGGVWSSVWC